MTTAIVDDRRTKDAESERLAKRADVRRRLAEIDNLKVRARFLRERKLKPLDQRLEDATKVHQATVHPVQDELKQLESDIAGRLASRAEIPPEMDHRRQQLLTELADANDELQSTAKQTRRERVPIEHEIQQLELLAGKRQSIENELRSESLANPQLFLQAFVCDRSIRWLEGRVGAAREQVKRWEGSDEYAGRLRRWSAELKAATEALNQAKAESEELARRIVEE